MRISGCHRVAALCAAGFLAACSGAAQQALPALSNVQRAMSATAVSKITVTPKTLSLLGTGAGNAKSVTVSEKSYTGTFTETTTCKGIATAAPGSGRGPSFKVTITGAKAGSCSVTFADTKKNRVVLPISDTTVSVALSETSISPASKSATIVLKSVDGKPPASGLHTSVTANLASCAKGCTVAGPQSPPGTDVYSITIFDGANGKGNKLAAVSATAKVAAAKNTVVSASLSKIPAYLKFGTVPSATAGTPLTSVLPLSVEDADHDTITGSYSTPVTVTSSDASPIAQGSALQVGSGSVSRTVQLTTSSDALKLVYGGLAIGPVTLSASATGVSRANVQFAPSIGNLGYKGPEVNGAPEIDLYNPTSGQTGNSSSFSLSQAGWSESPYDKGFTYALGGGSNNCTSFTVSPRSGTGTSFTVSVAASPAPTAGTCILTATGATTSSAVKVALTYTTGSVGLEGKHRSKRATR
jgi:hypothetical protein